jgi:hypothetical protein
MTFVGAGPHAVVGCTLPSGAQAAAVTVRVPNVQQEVMQSALNARDAQAPALLAHPEVQAVGVGASLDNPGEAAIEFFVTRGMARTDIPAQINGIRTRIVEGELFSRRGAAISAADSVMNERSASAPRLVYSISAAEMARANAVHAAHAKELMELAGVQGVGVTSSVDSPGEAALMIFVIRGVTRAPIPAVIDGLRTRVRESSRFRAGYGDVKGQRAQKACIVPGTRRSLR